VSESLEPSGPPTSADVAALTNACDVCGLAGARGKPHGIGGHMDDDETWPWCPGGKPPRAAVLEDMLAVPEGDGG
jgi:hypothetical protein